MLSSFQVARLLAGLLLAVIGTVANAQSFQVQCPSGTVLHRADPSLVPGVTQTPVLASAPHAVTGPDGNYYTYSDSSGYYDTVTHVGRTDGLLNPTPAMANPHIKCQQISGGDGFATMGDGTQMYLFAFGPLSGFGDMVRGLGGTEPASVYNQTNLMPDGVTPLDVIRVGSPGAHETFNGAIGLIPDPDPAANNELDGHVDARMIMDVGTMNGNMPSPMFVIDEGDEFFLTLTNVGMVMRPDLFEQHTVHFHGYPNASGFYDGVPDVSVAINIGASFTYYYLAPEAGTYMWHCHVSPPEHLQMGMVGQVYVRPRQNGASGDLGAALKTSNQRSYFGVADPSLVGTGCNDILCTDQTPLPPGADAISGATGATNAAGQKFAYNDGDGSTAYDVDYPINMHGFDPNFHFVGMTFNPESFTDNKDKYFLLNGRSYPDTVGGYECESGDTLPQCAGKAEGDVVAGPMTTQSTDGALHVAQPQHALINIPLGGKALLRFSDLNVTEFHTLASLGIPMRVVGKNARMLRDLDGNNMSYVTNSITLGGGESIDVILDACSVRAGDGSCITPYPAGSVFFLYTPQLDHLSNDAENFGGMMTEVHILSCPPSSFNPTTKLCS